MIQPYQKSTDITIMIWGAIWLDGRSDLVIMERDDESKGGDIQLIHISKFLKKRYQNASNLT